MTQIIGTSYQVSVPALSDVADITNAFKYYHQGGLTGSPAANSIEQYLINIWGTAGDTSTNSLLNLKNWTGYDAATLTAKGSISSRLLSIEGSVGSNILATYVKIAPSSNSTASTSNVISPTTASVIPLQVKGIVGQTANLQEWQTSAATVAYVTSAGKIYSNNGLTGTSTDEVVTLSGTQTLTNKTLINPFQTIGTNAKTTSYTLVASDQSKIIEINSSSATNLTIPSDAAASIPVGSYVVVIQVGTGQITLTPDIGVTVNSTPGLKLRTQWSMATIIKRGANLWVVSGDTLA